MLMISNKIGHLTTLNFKIYILYYIFLYLSTLLTTVINSVSTSVSMNENDLRCGIKKQSFYCLSSHNVTSDISVDIS